MPASDEAKALQGQGASQSEEQGSSVIRDLAEGTALLKNNSFK